MALTPDEQMSINDAVERNVSNLRTNIAAAQAEIDAETTRKLDNIKNDIIARFRAGEFRKLPKNE